MIREEQPGVLPCKEQKEKKKGRNHFCRHPLVLADHRKMYIEIALGYPY